MKFEDDCSLTFNGQDEIIPSDRIRDVILFELGNHNQLIFNLYKHAGQLLTPSVIFKMADLIEPLCKDYKGVLTYKQIKGLTLGTLLTAKKINELIGEGISKNANNKCNARNKE